MRIFGLLKFYLIHLAPKIGFLQVNMCYSYVENMYKGQKQSLEAHLNFNAEKYCGNLHPA
jgi:hypothetical protein